MIGKMSVRPESPEISGCKTGRFMLMAVLAILFAASGPVISSYINDRYSKESQNVSLNLKDMGGWKFHTSDHDEILKPNIQNPNYSVEGQYRKNGIKVDVFAYAYTSVGEGREIIAYNNLPYKPKIWKIASQIMNSVKIDENKSISIPELTVKNGEKLRLISLFYVVNGRVTGNKYTVKYREGLEKLLGEHMDSRLYIVAIDISGQDKKNREELRGLVTRMIKSHEG